MSHLVLIAVRPNYLSAWPLVELIVNHLSDVSYEEQHINRFTYYGARSKLRALYPRLDADFVLECITTTHFLSPFVAWISPRASHELSRLLKHRHWKLPFGCLLLLALRKQAPGLAQADSTLARTLYG